MEWGTEKIDNLAYSRIWLSMGRRHAEYEYNRTQTLTNNGFVTRIYVNEGFVCISNRVRGIFRIRLSKTPTRALGRQERLLAPS